MANDQVGKHQTCHPPKLNEYESKNELYANLKSGQKKVRLRLRGSWAAFLVERSWDQRFVSADEMGKVSFSFLLVKVNQNLINVLFASD